MAVLETPAECAVRIENEEIKFNISGIQLDQFIDDHHQLTIRIQEVAKKDADRDFSEPQNYTRFLGSSVSLNLRATGGMVEEGAELEFVGVVTDVQLENSIDGMNVVLLHASSPTIAMDGIARNAHYHDQSISDIVSSLVAKYPLTVGRIESTEGTLEFNTQYRETDYDYIMRLAGAAGKFAYYNGSEFNFTAAAGSETVALSWRGNLGVFRLGLGTAPMEFKTDVYNYEQKKTYSQDSKSISQQASLSEISRVSPEASKKIFKDSSFSQAGRVGDAQALDRKLENERGRAMGSMVRCTGQSVVPAVGVGKALEISGMESLDGQYWVKGVRHIFDESGKYHNIFICTPMDIAYPERKHVEQELEVEEKPITAVTSSQTVRQVKEREIRGLQVARVINLEDPEKLGRIKVSYPWLDSEETAWVRIAVPHAGKDRGWYSLPEIDDEVLVGFENGDSDYPVVLGSLYNKDNSPMDEAYSADNNIKMFMTRSGNRIVMNDEDGGEQIVISQKDGKNQIVLDLSGPSISISSEGDISVSGKNLNVEANEGINLKAGSDIKMEGVNIEIKASGNMKSEAGANNDISGSAQVNVKGGMINLN
ncbi:MAG: phage baseplate assembly protein V [Candidatus Krumholzibacteriales bacterium]